MPQAIILTRTPICQASLLALHADELPFLGSDRSSFTNFANRRGKIESKIFIRVGEINGMGIAILRGHREQ
jgi:hypothetical protein